MHFRLARPGGGVGERPPRLLSSSFRNSASGVPEEVTWLRLRFRAPGQRIWKPRRLSLLPAEGAESPLAGAGPQGLLTACIAWIPSHSRESEFSCLGLQSYSRRLCLSRGKHYRLYP